MSDASILCQMNIRSVSELLYPRKACGNTLGHLLTSPPVCGRHLDGFNFAGDIASTSSEGGTQHAASCAIPSLRPTPAPPYLAHKSPPSRWGALKPAKGTPRPLEAHTVAARTTARRQGPSRTCAASTCAAEDAEAVKAVVKAAAVMRATRVQAAALARETTVSRNRPGATYKARHVTSKRWRWRRPGGRRRRPRPLQGRWWRQGRRWTEAALATAARRPRGGGGVVAVAMLSVQRDGSEGGRGPRADGYGNGDGSGE